VVDPRKNAHRSFRRREPPRRLSSLRSTTISSAVFLGWDSTTWPVRRYTTRADARPVTVFGSPNAATTPITRGRQTLRNDARATRFSNARRPAACGAAVGKRTDRSRDRTLYGRPNPPASNSSELSERHQNARTSGCARLHCANELKAFTYVHILCVYKTTITT